jgi:hypothetical protein
MSIRLKLDVPEGSITIIGAFAEKAFAAKRMVSVGFVTITPSVVLSIKKLSATNNAADEILVAMPTFCASKISGRDKL